MGEETWGPLLGVVILVAVVAPIAWVVINGRAWLRNHALLFLKRTFEKYGAVDDAQKGYVQIRFPIYFGAIVTVGELTANSWVPRSNATRMINELSFFSIKFGLVTIFAPYVAFMIVVNYIIHLLRISSNQAGGA